MIVNRRQHWRRFCWTRSGERRAFTAHRELHCFITSKGDPDNYCLKWHWLRYLNNDRDCRDIVSCGSSSGVSAAFRAPVGDVHFALDGLQCVVVALFSGEVFLIQQWQWWCSGHSFKSAILGKVLRLLH
ncbi:Chloride channel, voltage gated [Corchorus capsularis]|uniref:Chloride channel, voltage gated n=1 Tax=Corchorus capsularis TaxID=210143 RepID=A0A1R3JJ13_COCAP|nr:Chloride channel, voltage gated [Corchorus capsularis]